MLHVMNARNTSWNGCTQVSGYKAVARDRCSYKAVARDNISHAEGTKFFVFNSKVQDQSMSRAHDSAHAAACKETLP